MNEMVEPDPYSGTRFTESQLQEQDGIPVELIDRWDAEAEGLPDTWRRRVRDLIRELRNRRKQQ